MQDFFNDATEDRIGCDDSTAKNDAAPTTTHKVNIETLIRNQFEKIALAIFDESKRDVEAIFTKHQIDIPEPLTENEITKIIDLIIDAYMRKKNGYGCFKILQLARNEIGQALLYNSEDKFNLKKHNAGIKPMNFYEKKYKKIMGDIGLPFRAIVRIDPSLWRYHMLSKKDMQHEVTCP